MTERRTAEAEAVMDSLHPQLASVGMSTGRWYLKVGGVVVAVESDPCRDQKFLVSCWDKASLDSACYKINAAAR